MKEEVICLASKWIQLSDSLRIPEGIQSSIQKQYSEPELCLRAVLIAWLNKQYNHLKYGPPTWRVLAEAVAKQAGCNDPAQAEKIAQNHPGKD